VALVRTDVSDEITASIIRVEITSKLGDLQILFTLMMETTLSSETSVLTRATRHNIAEDGILYCHHRENLRSYIALTGWTL
jgi:hypothetical protein